MRKILIGVVLGIFMISFLSASVVFDIQPNAVYNKGDKVEISINIFPEPEFNEVVSVFLVCGSVESEVYKEFISTTDKVEKDLEIPLLTPLIGDSYGNCKFNVKAGDSISEDSESFEISKLINLEFLDWGETFDPGVPIEISGSAVKDNGKNANGIYEIQIENLFFSGEVLNGEIDVLFTIPENFPAGEHKVNLSIFEKDSKGEILNSGNKISFLEINQIPKSIEIVLDEREIMPGNDIKGKVVLHDQTGQNIEDEEVYIALKYSDGKILQKFILKTGEDFIYSIIRNETPSILQISVYSGEIINHEEVKILENKEISSEIVENILILTNVGNVFYNDTLLVLIGEKNVSLPLLLKIGESAKYKLSAPDGNYEVYVNGVKNNVFLSGNAIDVRKVLEEYSFNFLSLVIWILALLILSFGSYTLFKKSRKKSTYGKVVKVNPNKSKKVTLEKGYDGKTSVVKSSSKNHSVQKSELLVGSEAIVPSKRSELSLSLSINGKKQSATMGCIYLRNYPEISSGVGGVKETLSKIFSLVESNKGMIYSNANYIFFILAPHSTRTFDNQKEGVILAQKIKAIIEEHNKKFKQKIDFGISLNYGDIIIKADKEKTNFMSLGTFMISAKKLASYSKGDILITDSLKSKIDMNTKGESVEVSGIKAYKVDALVDKNVHSTFISGFIARQERDKLKESGTPK